MPCQVRYSYMILSPVCTMRPGTSTSSMPNSGTFTASPLPKPSRFVPRDRERSFCSIVPDIIKNDSCQFPGAVKYLKQPVENELNENRDRAEIRGRLKFLIACPLIFFICFELYHEYVGRRGNPYSILRIFHIFLVVCITCHLRKTY